MSYLKGTLHAVPEIEYSN